MKKTHYMFSLPLFAILLALLPTTALAQSTYRLLAPLGPLTGDVTLTGYLEGIMMVIIGVAGILAVVMIVICGIQMIGSPSVSQKSASKTCITNAIFGLILAFSSWLVLNTINTQLLSSEVTLPTLPVAETPTAPTAVDAPLPRKAGWYFRYREGGAGQIFNSPQWVSPEACLEGMKATRDSGGTIEQTDGKECFQVFAPPLGTPPPPAGSPPIGPPAGEASVRRDICGNDSCIGATPVGIKQGPCPVGVANCAKSGYINVAGMPSDAIDVIKGLPGPVVITGGTESGHATHRPNAAIFDLRKSRALDSHIRSNATQSAVSFYPCRYLLNGFWFTDEADHWHVCKVDEPYWFCKDQVSKTNTNTLPEGIYKNCPR